MSDELKPDFLAVWIALGGDEPRRETGWVKIRCILHEERNASATINVDAGRFNCFAGCVDRPVDVYELIQRVEGCESFAQAKQRAEVLAGHRSREVRSKSDEGGPRLPRSARDQRDRRAYRPTWRMS